MAVTKGFRNILKPFVLVAGIRPAYWWTTSGLWAFLVKLDTRKSAISRIENHAEDITLSTLEKFAHALGKSLRLEVA